MKVLRKIYTHMRRQARIIGTDIVATRNFPKDLKKGWKEGAQIAKSKNQSIFTAVGTKAKEATKQGIVPHLPGLTALSMCWIPMVGMTESGYLIGRLLRKALSKKLNLPL